MEKNHRKKDIRYIEYLNSISENIKLLRTGLGWSQQTLVEKAGISRSTIQSAVEALDVDLDGGKETKSKRKEVT